MLMKCENCRWRGSCGGYGACDSWFPSDPAVIRCDTCLYCQIERRGFSEAVDCLCDGLIRETCKGLRCRHWRLMEREDAVPRGTYAMYAGRCSIPRRASW